MKLRRALPRRGGGRLFPVGAALLAAVLHGCGLETVVLLNAPGTGAPDELAKTFTIFLTSANNEPEFRGIEAWYKFYQDIGSFENGLATQSDLIAAGFRRLTSLRESSTLPNPPLIPVDIVNHLGDAAKITLDFSGLENPSPALPAMTVVPDVTLLSLPAQSEFRRGVPADDGSSFKRFFSLTADNGFRSSDPDIVALGLTPGENVVYIGLYVLSYGLQDLTSPTYSRAVPLSPISIPIQVVP